MAEENRNSSRVFLGGVIISTVVGLGLLALIFSAVAPGGEKSPAPTASTPAQTAASPAATSTAQTATAPVGGTTATSGTGTSGTPAPTGAESNGTAANGTAAGGTAGSAGTAAGEAATSSGNAAENGAENSTARPAGNSQSGAGATATTQAAASQEKQQLQPVAFTGANGEALYTQACQSCHMPGGRGAQGAGRYPALANNPRVASAPYVMTMILNGHGGMPGFGHYLSDQQIAEIVNYVRGELNKQQGTATPGDVKQLRPQNPDYTIFGESAG
ncbi:cytochrome c6 [Deinococcus carri]|uniref:Cytochrome c6 n=1 Tax=Deinococcus carri TaxID=1211323 RepID=A0ABP9W483_9DEIO